mmetsp:Transcript_16626/g.39492  ORF Transcript_16626/g.39492 Transcript_16626/m.39492 type:complete len:202 (+) Transcript_16626:64-669(+)
MIMLHLCQVECPCRAPQPQASQQELLNLYGSAAISVKQLEEGPRVRHVQLQGLEVGLDRFLVHVLLQLHQADVARHIGIQVGEEGPYLPYVSLLVVNDVLHDHLMVALGAFYSTLAENACHHIKHSEVAKTYIEQEEESAPLRDNTHRSQCILPTDPAADCHEQRQHGGREILPVLIDGNQDRIRIVQSTVASLRIHEVEG